MTDGASIVNALKLTLGEDLVQHIQECKILLVGAGGIGCELLKNLALSGFQNLTIVDLDTIDVSNLNRQLLFRAQHVGKPKCTTAAEVATSMALPTQVKYTALHGNVCDASTFNVNFMQQFDLVLNALDNLTARRRVNRLCLAASVPLVEAGTTGYLGQANVIAKGEVACYECQTVETPKVYPICTIRATPSRPVHTIVWSKEFYKLLFGAKEQESMLFEDTATLDGEVSTYMDAVRNVRGVLQGTQVRDEGFPALITKLLECLYIEEIQKQLELDRYKAAAKTPVPLDATRDTQSAVAALAPTIQSAYRATDADCWKTHQLCVAELQHVLEHFDESFPESFDKDHDGAMRFVTAASNLRNLVFGIEPIQSVYSAKGIAGNIIPAIATTNAIAAGLQMMQVYQVLTSTKLGKGSIAENCRYCNILRNPTRNGLAITAVALEKPNPNCFVCRQGSVHFSCDTATWTLEHFLKRILTQELGFQEPNILLGDTQVWEQGEGSDQATYEINLPKLLSKLPGGGIQNGSIVCVEDFTQDLELSIHVSHETNWPKKEGAEASTKTEEYPFTLKGGSSAAAAAPTNGDAKPAAAAAVDSQQQPDEDEDDDDDIIVVVKRKGAPDGDDSARAAKKQRKEEQKKPPVPNDNEVIMIDD
mmetsp:Transcript_13248/g.36590  ORF Transcript_13248/g.36590 Transcript_13248/m.36590 type:complete len:649 (-) Transcript_13248:708-2654(-)